MKVFECSARPSITLNRCRQTYGKASLEKKQVKSKFEFNHLTDSIYELYAICRPIDEVLRFIYSGLVCTLKLQIASSCEITEKVNSSTESSENGVKSRVYI